MKRTKTLLIALGLYFLLNPLFAQFTTDDYKKALWMTTRMYGGQRDGQGPNWLIMDHNVSNNGITRKGVDFISDQDNGYDLSGGWHDCADHVKFGQTQYYSGYVLLLGYSIFPTGYDDYYSADYNGYHSAQDFTWEGKKGVPNGIPDILDEVKYATDYFIKCIKDENTFYSQVGDGDYDHTKWVTSVYMSTLAMNVGGEPRPVLKNPDDASMVSFCGAALAAMSVEYRKFDKAYADTCLAHAIYAYQYAKAHPKANAYTISGSYYTNDNDWRDNFVCLCAELYRATGQTQYKTEALGYSSNIGENYWVLDYQNSQDLALYHLAKLGDGSALTKLQNTVNRYLGDVNSQGVIQVGGSWGQMRYCANACFSVSIYQSLSGATSVNTDVQNSINYIFGDNSASQSFVVGFGSKSPQHPHHRNIYLDDTDNIGNQLSIPSRNKQHGYMVGGTYSPSSFTDDINTYSTSEGCIDYQAGLEGVLAFINSTIAPVDTSKFNPLLNTVKVSTFDFSIFPNPATNHLYVQPIGVQNCSISILTTTGSAVMSLEPNEGMQQIDISKLNTGIYILRITSGDKISTSRFAKM